MDTPKKLPAFIPHVNYDMNYRLEKHMARRTIDQGDDYTFISFRVCEHGVDVLEAVTKKGFTRIGISDEAMSPVAARKLWASRVRAGYSLDEAYKVFREDDD